MHENDREHDESAADEGSLRRTTEQGDELTEEHSLWMREHRATKPYVPPRQPSQAPPEN